MSDVELGRLLLSIVSLLSVALFMGGLFEKLRMPPVIGEIFGGLLLGPTFLGFFAPNIYDYLFNAFPSQSMLLSAFYWIGLILLMFSAGLRVQRELTKDERRMVIVLLIASIILPMIGGWNLTLIIDIEKMAGVNVNPISFHLILAIATAVTSIPVISRIFIDLGIMHTHFAKITLMTATLQDLVLWTALAVATGISTNSQTDASTLLINIFTTLSFIGITIAIGPNLLLWARNWLPLRKGSSVFLGYSLLICFALSTIASLLNINVIFGALVAGVLIGSLPHDIISEVRQRVSDVALWFFVPIYFAIVGLKLDLIRQFDLELTLMFLVVSSVLKLGGVVVSLKFTGESITNAVNYGIAMNTRGGPGIVLASVALGFGLITETFFVTLVITSIVTSLVAGLWLRRAMLNKSL